MLCQISPTGVFADPNALFTNHFHYSHLYWNNSTKGYFLCTQGRVIN